MNPLALILIIVLVVVVLGGLPHWPHSAAYGWGWYPSGGAGLLLVVLVVLLLLGRF